MQTTLETKKVNYTSCFVKIENNITTTTKYALIITVQNVMDYEYKQVATHSLL